MVLTIGPTRQQGSKFLRLTWPLGGVEGVEEFGYLVDMGIYYISSTIYYYINKVKLSRGCVKLIYCLITKWLH